MATYVVTWVVPKFSYVMDASSGEKAVEMAMEAHKEELEDGKGYWDVTKITDRSLD